jgi:hypothetical protein
MALRSLETSHKTGLVHQECYGHDRIPKIVRNHLVEVEAKSSVRAKGCRSDWVQA